MSLYGRGVARRLKGDARGADSDMQAATATKDDIAQAFEKFGTGGL